MADYSQHIMRDWGWYNEYRARMGKEACDQYVSNVYKLLLSMQPGSFFSIEKNVNPENRDLFIKICCMFIQEQFMSEHPRDFHHSFNEDYTEIRCVEIKIRKIK